MNKFRKALKPLPTIVIKRMIKSKNGETKEIEFHYPNEDEYILEDSKGQGIGIEMELVEEIPLSMVSELNKILSDAGVLCESSQFSRFQKGKKNFSFSVNDTANQQRIKILEALRLVVLPNLSYAIVKEPHFDKTCNLGQGGIEIVFSPFSLGALPILKAEIARVLYWRRKFGLKMGAPNCSTHLNMSLEMWGANTDERADRVQRFLRMLWFCKEFVLEISNRKGVDEDYASLLWMIGDSQGKFTQDVQDILFMSQKITGINMIKEYESVPSNEYLHAAGASDDRIKGIANTTYNGNNAVVEHRMFATPDGTLKISDEDWYVAVIQYGFAVAEMASTPWDFGMSYIDCRNETLGIFLNVVYEKRHTDYRELWNLLLEMKTTAKDMKRLKMDTSPIPIEPLDMGKVLAFDYSMFEELVNKQSVFNAPEESLAPIQNTVQVIEPIVEQVILPEPETEPEPVRMFRCCDCDKESDFNDFNLEIEKHMEDNDMTKEESIEDTNEEMRWCNECFLRHKKEDEDDEDGEDETFECTECGDWFDIEEEKCIYKGRAVCNSCHDDLT